MSEANRKWFTREQLEGKPRPVAQPADASFVFDGFLRGVGGAMVPPAGRFLNAKEILNEGDLLFHHERQTQAREAKLLLGLFGARCERMKHKSGYKPVGGTPIGARDDRHIVTIAGSRSGKGRSVLVPNLLTYPGSMLVIDPKGDLATFTAEHRQNTLRQQVHVLDPFHVADVPASLRASFNPMRMLPPESKTRVEDAGAIADALVPSRASDNDPHWDESARQFIETLILHIATSARIQEQERTLLTLAAKSSEAMIQTEDGDNLLYQEMLDNPSDDGAVIRGARAFYDRHDRELQSVLSTLRRHLHFLDYGQIREVLGAERSIDLRDLKRRPTTVYLTLPATRMGTCSRWLRLFVNLTLAAAELEPTHPMNPHPVLMCLDEFAVLGTMKSIEDAAGQIAGFNVRLWPILQDLGQLKSLYSDRWESFLGNSGIIQCFGNSDNFTLDWISKRLGMTRAFNSNDKERTWRGEMNQEPLSRTSEASHPLMSPDEIARFFGRDDPMLRQLIIRPTFAPMVLQRLIYDEYPAFQGQYRERTRLDG